ncbi:MAG: hypothetical protein PWP15_959 [Methanothermococcus sp.]|jgi:hypothetical protein|uniref:cell wall-binding repeat-containing protein n=1 Tax=Methanothermococcus TaxID=155862 RepID=UPI000379496A|nr:MULTISPECIES: cell wall-binding repeat 2 family protein [Methanothermococcus]MDK2790452.1 hypothetical protein [Methanothermococcus sp.]MDK2987755.1 hypothetical protein [Methanothermococcus sp.]
MDHKNILLIIFLIFLSSLTPNTAIKIGEKPSLSNVVIITNENWPDYITAVDYAHISGGIILQTDGDRLNPDVENIIKSVNPEKIVIVGGHLAVSEDVENDLMQYGNVIRVWGTDRIKTNEQLLKTYINDPNDSERLCIVNGYKFNEVVTVSNDYVPVYGLILVLDPGNTIRVYENDRVKIYTSNRYYGKKYFGTYRKNQIREIPGKIVILEKADVNSKYCYNPDICEFGYTKANISTSTDEGILITKNTPAALLLSKYLDIPVITAGKTVIYLEDDPIKSSITVAVDILVLKKTKELYRINGGDFDQALDEAKTQLWSKQIPVEKYNIPYRYAKKYVENN